MQTKPKSRLGKLMMATLAGAVAFGGLGVTLAQAEDGKGEAASVQALMQSKLTLADAIRTAEAAGQGTVTGAEFEVKNDGTYFAVTTQSGTIETDHRIDPETGKILSSTPATDEVAADQGEDGESGETEGQEQAGTDTAETEDLAAIQGAKVTLMQAIADAEAQGGKALSAEFSSENGALAVAVMVADAGGKITELMVDAGTGKVIVGDQDGGDEGDEGGEEQEG